ncbi:MAG: type II toxin-antitoxin system RelB/DinJ family antitoxin [Patescibacteria group bacterium]
MSTKAMSQIQVRIDNKTKQQAKKVLEGIGLDLSSAIKLHLKQIINIGTLPYEIRDENGFSPKKAQELREADREARTSKKSYTSVDALMKDLMS